MPGSTFNGGFMNGLTVRNMPISVTNPGQVYWLSNATTLQAGQRGGSDGNNGTLNSPFATLNYAISQCTAGRGDIIMVKPGHAETVSSAGAVAASIAGVTVIGLGTGTARPKWTLDTANTATILVSAANVAFINCQFVGNFLSLATCFALSTAKGFTLQNCSFADAGATTNFLNCVKSTGAANTIDGLYITDCTWDGLGTTSVNSFVLSLNDINSATLLRNFVKLNRSADASILMTITNGVLTNLNCGDNVVISQQTATTAGSLINVGGSTSTGAVYRNFAGTLTTSSDKLFTTTAGLYPYENRVSGVVGATGFVIPAVDS